MNAFVRANKCDRILNLMPLSSIAEQILCCHMPMRSGCTVSFPSSTKGRLSPKAIVDLCHRVRPSIFISVPRVFEKISTRTVPFYHAASGFVRRISAWAARKCIEGVKAFEQNKRKPAGFGYARRKVFYPLRIEFGFDRCKFAGVYGKLNDRFANVFLGAGIILHNMFGDTETTGFALSTKHLSWAPDSVGVPVTNGGKVKIAKDELLVQGTNVCLGYLQADGSLNKVVDADGFYHTCEGAKATKVNGNQVIVLTKRMKNVIYTCGCEPLAPCDVENAIKQLDEVQ